VEALEPLPAREGSADAAVALRDASRAAIAVATGESLL